MPFDARARLDAQRPDGIPIRFSLQPSPPLLSSLLWSKVLFSHEPSFNQPGWMDEKKGFNAGSQPLRFYTFQQQT